MSVTTQSYGIIPNNSQLIQDGQSCKEYVADERNDSQLPVQFPSVNVNGHKKKNYRKEQCAGDEDQSSAVDFYRVVCIHKDGLNEPRQAQTKHVKYIRADNIGHGHVSFPCWNKKHFKSVLPYSSSCKLYM